MNNFEEVRKTVLNFLQESTDIKEKDLLEFSFGTVSEDSSISKKVKSFKTVNCEEFLKAGISPVDIIFSSTSMHRIEETRSTLIKCYESLRDGGKIYIADLNKGDGSFFNEDNGNIHHKGFCRDLFQNILKSIGFKNVEAKTICQIEKNGKTYKIFLAQGEK